MTAGWATVPSPQPVYLLREALLCNVALRVLNLTTLSFNGPGLRYRFDCMFTGNAYCVLNVCPNLYLLNCLSGNINRAR